MRVLIVEDEPLMAEAIRDGLRLEAIAADIAGDGHTALELLSVDAYDMALLDRDIPGPTGDEIAKRLGSTTMHIPRPDGSPVAFSRPVVNPAPSGEVAGRLWDRLVTVVTTPGFSELKCSRGPEPILQ
jgi:hypothetical protein